MLKRLRWQFVSVFMTRKKNRRTFRNILGPGKIDKHYSRQIGGL